MSTADVTQMLVDWSNGDRAALDRLIPLVYGELHRLANYYLRYESGENTLQATVLVNEAYLRLIDQKRVRWQNRAHFFGVAAQLMRRILIDHVRSHQADKRGGGRTHLPLDEALVAAPGQTVDLLALDAALSELAAFDELQSQIVEMRYFAGLNIEETAEALDISPATVKREWNMAKAWLHSRLSRDTRTTK